MICRHNSPVVTVGDEARPHQPAVGWQVQETVSANGHSDEAPIAAGYYRLRRATPHNGANGASPALDRDLEWTEVNAQGGRAGDRYIKYLRPRGQALTRTAPGEVLQVDQIA